MIKNAQYNEQNQWYIITFILNSEMKLPKIQENQNPLRSEYYKTITDKPFKKSKGEKINIDWQLAELDLAQTLPDHSPFLEELITFQKACLIHKIPHSYSYFYVRKLQSTIKISSSQTQQNEEGQNKQHQEQIQKIKQTTQLINSETSDWHKITRLIKLRESLLARMKLLNDTKKQQLIFNLIDDLRFMNFEIIAKVNQWKQQNNVDGHDFEAMFFHENRNYLNKMINDNIDIINGLNHKRVVYMTPPNPFFLSSDGNKSNMPKTEQQQIQYSMEVLAKEKAAELKSVIQPSKYASKNHREIAQLQSLKEHVYEEKMTKVQKIKNIYQTNTSFGKSIYNKTNKRNEGFSQPKYHTMDRKTPVESNRTAGSNNFQKMIRNKQIEELKNLENSAAKKKKIIHKSLGKTNDPINKYLQKANELKRQVQAKNNLQSKAHQTNKKQILTKIEQASEKPEKMEKADNLMKISTISQKSTQNKLPKTVSEVKATKPKIKLVMEKETFVEDVVKTFIPNKDLEMYKSMHVRNNTSSSFFKPLPKIQEKQKQQNKAEIDMKPITHFSRSSSAIGLNTQTSKFPKKEKLIIKPKKKDLSKSNSINLSDKLSPEKQQELRQSQNLRVINKRLRQEMIRSVYEQKPKHKITSKSPYRSTMKLNDITDIEQKDQQKSKGKVDVELHEAKKRLKNLSIYQKSEQKPKHKTTSKSPYSSTMKLNDITDIEQQKSKGKVDAKLDEAKKRLKNLSIYQKSASPNKQIMTHRPSSITSIYGTSKKPLTNKIGNKFYANKQKIQKQEKDLKEQNTKQQEKLNEKIHKKQEMIEKLKQKDKRIEELVSKLKKEEQSLADNGDSKNEEYLKLEKLKEEKIAEIEQARQKMVVQNLELKQKMEEEEKKFIDLKEQEFRMKEEQLKNKYLDEMETLKEDFTKKNQEMEQRIIEQEKKRKENELRIAQQQRKMEQIERQLTQKKMKEQLLEQILKQQEEIQKLEAEKQKNSQEQALQRMRREIIEQQQMQRKALKTFEEENRKLSEMFAEMQRKNKDYQLENQRKQLQIKRLEEETRKSEENIKQIEQEMGMINDEVDAIQQSKNQPLNQDNDRKSDNQESEVQDIEAMKQRVKSEILKQMLAQKQVQEEQKKVEEAERARKIAELEEQIRRQLERQEEEMEKLEKQENERYEKMKQEIQDEYNRMKAEEEEKIKAELEKYEVLQKQQSHQLQEQQADQKDQEPNQKKEETDQKEQEGHQQNQQKDQNNQQTDQKEGLKHKDDIQAIKKTQNNQHTVTQNQQLNQQKDNFQNQQEKAEQQQQNNQVQDKKLENQKQEKSEQKQPQENKSVQQQKDDTQNNLQDNDGQKQQEKQGNKQKQEQEGSQNKLDTINEQQNKIQQGNDNNQQNQEKQQKQEYQEQNQDKSKSPQDNHQDNNDQQKAQQKQATQQIPNKKQGADPEKQTTKQQPQKQEKQPKKKDLHPVKQNSDEIITKYQNLQSHLTKSKLIYLEDRQVPEFLNNFYNSLGPEHREMLPYAKKDLQKLILTSNRKIDIYDNTSIGWLEKSEKNTTPKTLDRYVLIGQIGCIENIAKKYGGVQIQMVYYFNKTNPYQKQFLTKQIKIFQKIGYIFQKKLKEENMHSIKLIVKIPEEILPKKFNPPTKQFVVQTKVKIQNESGTFEPAKKYAVSYPLAQTLKNYFSADQQVQFKDSRDPNDLLLKKKMHMAAYNDENIKTEEIGDIQTQVSLHLNLKYIQTQSYSCFTLMSSQYSTLNDEKVYVSKVSDKLSLIMFQYQESQFSLDIVLDLKTQKMEKQLEVLVCVPLWKKDESIKYSAPGPKSYNYQHKVPTNMIFGSVIKTSIQKEQFKLLGSPFVFSLFETGENGVLLRALYGQVVEAKDLISVNH